MFSPLKSALYGGLAAMALAGSAQAATFTVTTTADSGTGSLRQAITDANATTTVDRIQFAIPVDQQVGGVWTIQPATQLPDVTTPVLLNGPGSTLLVLLGRGLQVTQPVTSSSPASSPQFVISGMTIRDGQGIVSVATRLRLEDVRLINNRAGTTGGGVCCFLTDIAANKCLFDGNHAVNGAGLGLRSGSTATVTDTTFSDNETDPTDALPSGGAIYGESNLTLSNCRFLGNRADMGSAIYLPRNDVLVGGAAGDAVISDCLFENNSQVGEQNALYNWGGTVTALWFNVTFNRTIFRGNNIQRGGAIYAQARNPGGNIKFNNCLIQGNKSLLGSAVFNEGSLVTLINSTVADNSTSSGGAIQDRKTGSLASFTTIVNCTLSRNGSAGGASEINAATGTVRLLNTLIRPVTGGASLTRDTGVITSLGHNLAEDNGGGFLKAAGDIINTPSKLDTMLRNNGGPTRTLALLADSPAIDAGDDSVLGSPYKLTSDQRPGFARKSGTHVDIGAFEVQTPAAALTASTHSF